MNIHPAMQSWADNLKKAHDAQTQSQAAKASFQSQRYAKQLNQQHSQAQAARQQGGAA